MQERLFPPFEVNLADQETREFISGLVKESIKLRKYYQEVYEIVLPHDILVVGPGYFIRSWVSRGPHFQDHDNGELGYSYGRLSPGIHLEHLIGSLEENGISRGDCILFIGDNATWQKMDDVPATIRISDDYSLHGYQFGNHPPQVFHVFNAEYVEK